VALAQKTLWRNYREKHLRICFIPVFTFFSKTTQKLQPSIQLLLRISQRILDPVLLAPYLICISLGDVSCLYGWIVVPVRHLGDLLVLELAVGFAVGALVDVDDDCATEAEVVLEGVGGVDVAVIGPA
jgi:hypothetical protein